MKKRVGIPHQAFRLENAALSKQLNAAEVRMGQMVLHLHELYASLELSHAAYRPGRFLHAAALRKVGRLMALQQASSWEERAAAARRSPVERATALQGRIRGWRG